MEKRSFISPEQLDSMLTDYLERDLLTQDESEAFIGELLDVNHVFSTLKKHSAKYTVSDENLPKSTCDICQKQQICEAVMGILFGDEAQH